MPVACQLRQRLSGSVTLIWSTRGGSWKLASRKLGTLLKVAPASTKATPLCTRKNRPPCRIWLLRKRPALEPRLAEGCGAEKFGSLEIGSTRELGGGEIAFGGEAAGGSVHITAELGETKRDRASEICFAEIGFAFEAHFVEMCVPAEFRAAQPGFSFHTHIEERSLALENGIAEREARPGLRAVRLTAPLKTASLKRASPVNWLSAS